MSQPLPAPGREPVTEQVIADLRARTEQGIQKYGRPLTCHNGRSPLQDLYEELLDGAQYVKQRLMEQDADPIRRVARAAREYVKAQRIQDAALAHSYPGNYGAIEKRALEAWKAFTAAVDALEGVDL